MRIPPLLRRAISLADRTPPERNRYVDFLRVVSILVVVLGHWLMVAVWTDGSGLRAENLLGLVPRAAWVTWLLQVMPIFFFVGGFANLASWRSARRRHIPYGAWLRERLRRLLLPVLPLLALWAAIGQVSWWMGVEPRLLQVASRAALVPVWFLAAYVVIVAIAPATLGAWERWGWSSVVAGAAAAGAVDLLTLTGVAVPLQWSNYLFVWGTVHQLGFAWAEGRLTGRAPAFALGGLLTTWILVAVGPYPVAMVGLDGGGVTNSNPPRVTLVALAVFQIGLVLAAERPVRRWLRRRGPWVGTVLVSGSIMTLYLWHLTAAVALVALTATALDGLGLGPVPTTPRWWATRPIWFAAAGVATIPLLALFGRFERPRSDPRPAPPPLRPLLAIVLTTAGLGLLARFGIVDEDGLNVFGVALPLVGVLLGGVVAVPAGPSGSSIPLRDRLSPDGGHEVGMGTGDGRPAPARIQIQPGPTPLERDLGDDAADDHHGPHRSRNGPDRAGADHPEEHERAPDGPRPQRRPPGTSISRVGLLGDGEAP